MSNIVAVQRPLLAIGEYELSSDSEHTQLVGDMSLGPMEEKFEYVYVVYLQI